MNQIYDHNNLKSDQMKNPEGFFQRLEVPHEKTREEVWACLDKRLTIKPSPEKFTFSSSRLAFGIAATFLLLAGTFSLIRFYTTNIYCPKGQHLSYTLPDNSTVELNADSRITYKPLWWRFDRQIHFEGEGFFEVKKGRKFEVVSEIGRTVVLGTSFDIYSRDKEYKVACISGTVSVISFSKEEVILSPDYKAFINADGAIVISKEKQSGESHTWINNMFHFTARPLALVMSEISRQYDVKITLRSGQDYSYSGYFSKNRPVEETLTLVCKPFGLTFARISEKEYEIYQN